MRRNGSWALHTAIQVSGIQYVCVPVRRNSSGEVGRYCSDTSALCNIWTSSCIAWSVAKGGESVYIICIWGETVGGDKSVTTAQRFYKYYDNNIHFLGGNFAGRNAQKYRQHSSPNVRQNTTLSILYLQYCRSSNIATVSHGVGGTEVTSSREVPLRVCPLAIPPTSYQKLSLSCMSLAVPEAMLLHAKPVLLYYLYQIPFPDTTRAHVRA